MRKTIVVTFESSSPATVNQTISTLIDRCDEDDDIDDCEMVGDSPLKSIFNFNVQMPGISLDLGREPSLADMVKHYYSQGFDDEKAQQLTEEYIDAFSKQW